MRFLEGMLYRSRYGSGALQQFSFDLVENDPVAAGRRDERTNRSRRGHPRPETAFNGHVAAG